MRFGMLMTVHEFYNPIHTEYAKLFAKNNKKVNILVNQAMKLVFRKKNLYIN